MCVNMSQYICVYVVESQSSSAGSDVVANDGLVTSSAEDNEFDSDISLQHRVEIKKYGRQIVLEFSKFSSVDFTTSKIEGNQYLSFFNVLTVTGKDGRIQITRAGHFVSLLNYKSW